MQKDDNKTGPFRAPFLSPMVIVLLSPMIEGGITNYEIKQKLNFKKGFKYIKKGESFILSSVGRERFFCFFAHETRNAAVAFVDVSRTFEFFGQCQGYRARLLTVTVLVLRQRQGNRIFALHFSFLSMIVRACAVFFKCVVLQLNRRHAEKGSIKCNNSKTIEGQVAVVILTTTG